MGLFSFLRIGKPEAEIKSAEIDTASDGIRVLRLWPFEIETRPAIDALCEITQTITDKDPNLLALKKLSLSRPFHRAVGKNGEQYQQVSEVVRVSLWYRDAEDGGKLLAEDMVLWREARADTNTSFATTHIIFGRRAQFAASIIPPCCEGESVLIAFLRAGEKDNIARKVAMNPVALKYNVANFFNDIVRFSVASSPQVKQMLLESYYHITEKEHECGKGFQFPAGYR